MCSRHGGIVNGEIYGAVTPAGVVCAVFRGCVCGDGGVRLWTCALASDEGYMSGSAGGRPRVRCIDATPAGCGAFRVGVRVRKYALGSLGLLQGCCLGLRGHLCRLGRLGRLGRFLFPGYGVCRFSIRIGKVRVSVMVWFWGLFLVGVGW